MSKQLDRVLTSLLISVMFAIVFVLWYFNTVDIDNIRAENKLLRHELTATKQEVVSLRNYIDERTHPATIQREQFNWIMREGKE